MVYTTTGRPFQRLARLARWTVAAAGLCFLTAGWRLESVLLPSTHWRIEGRWLLAAGLTTLVLAWSLRFVSAPKSMAVAMFLWAAVASLVLGHRPPQRGDVQVLSEETIVWTSEKEWNDPYMEADDRYGYRNRRQTASRHHHRDFDVVYHTDGEGWRLTAPAPRSSAAEEIALVGCSFTFGFGVADDAHYGALLAHRVWKGRRVGDYAVLGWGTAHAALVVEDLLARSQPPACILYGWLGKHRMRNYRRRTIRESATFDFPLFELEDDALTYRGLVPVAGNTWDESPQLDEREQRISVRLIEKMQRECDARDVEFFLLALESDERDTVLKEIIERGEVNVVDLSLVSRDYFPTDDHPAPAWHQKMARAIAGLDVLSKRLDDPTLRNAEAISRLNEGWWLSLFREAGADARLMRSEEQPPQVRVVPAPATDRVGGVELIQHLSIQGGQTYRLQTRLKADRPRDVQFVLGQAHPPWKGSEKPVLVRVERDWQEVTVEFQPPEDFPHGKLSMLLMKSSVPLEVTETRLWLQDRDVLAEAPTVAVYERHAAPARGERASEAAAR